MNRLDPIRCIEMESGNFTCLAEFYDAWGASYQQISPGAFQGSLRMATTDDFSLMNDIWSESILVRGSIPKGARVFSATTSFASSQRYKGDVLEDGELITVADGVEIDYQTLGAFDGLAVSFTESTVERYLRITGRAEEWAGAKDAILPKRSRTAAARVGKRWKQVLTMLMNPPKKSGGGFDHLARWARDEILDSITEDSVRVRPEPLRNNRLSVADRARIYLESHCERPISLGELCGEVEANERTLLLGFHELTGCSPGVYHRAIRYNLARHDLLDSNSGVTVTEVATRWGFYHFGRFSVGYRKQFGESPGKTLARP